METVKPDEGKVPADSTPADPSPDTEPSTTDEPGGSIKPDEVEAQCPDTSNVVEEIEAEAVNSEDPRGAMSEIVSGAEGLVVEFEDDPDQPATGPSAQDDTKELETESSASHNNSSASTVPRGGAKPPQGRHTFVRPKSRPEAAKDKAEPFKKLCKRVIDWESDVGKFVIDNGCRWEVVPGQKMKKLVIQKGPGSETSTEEKSSREKGLSISKSATAPSDSDSSRSSTRKPSSSTDSRPSKTNSISSSNDTTGPQDEGNVKQKAKVRGCVRKK